ERVVVDRVGLATGSKCGLEKRRTPQTGTPLDEGHVERLRSSGRFLPDPLLLGCHSMHSKIETQKRGAAANDGSGIKDSMGQWPSVVAVAARSSVEGGLDRGRVGSPARMVPSVRIVARRPARGAGRA